MYAHQNLIKYRDLKPSSIFVSGKGWAKPVNFGTAKPLTGEQIDNASATGLLTIAYASPEQGERAFSGGLLSRIEPDPILKQLKRLPGDLNLIVRKAIAPELSDRYSSVEQFSEDIRRHQAGESVLGHPESATYRATKFIRRNRLAVAAAGWPRFGRLSELCAPKEAAEARLQ